MIYVSQKGCQPLSKSRAAHCHCPPHSTSVVQLSPFRYCKMPCHVQARGAPRAGQDSAQLYRTEPITTAVQPKGSDIRRVPQQRTVVRTHHMCNDASMLCLGHAGQYSRIGVWCMVFIVGYNASMPRALHQQSRCRLSPVILQWCFNAGPAPRVSASRPGAHFPAYAQHQRSRRPCHPACFPVHSNGSSHSLTSIGTLQAQAVWPLRPFQVPVSLS